MRVYQRTNMYNITGFIKIPSLYSILLLLLIVCFLDFIEAINTHLK